VVRTISRIYFLQTTQFKAGVALRLLHFIVLAARLALIQAILKYTNSCCKMFDGEVCFFAFNSILTFVLQTKQVLCMTLSSRARNTLQLAAAIFLQTAQFKAMLFCVC